MANKIVKLVKKVNSKKNFDIKTRTSSATSKKEKETKKEEKNKISKKPSILEVIKNKITKKKVATKSIFQEIKDSLSKDKKKNLKSTKVKKEQKKEKVEEVKQDFIPKEVLKLHKSINNPIIEPRPYDWESKATFNPTAFILDGKIHIIYRAIGDGDVSVLGYASSFDGYNIEDRLTHHIYRRFVPYIKKEGESLNYCSGGGWLGGCEDPRVTILDGVVYVLYNAFDGWSSVRVAMISISLEDFKKKKWNWTEPIFLSPKEEIQKNWVLFSEKINGKFVILYDIWPCVGVKYFDNFDDFKSGKIKIPKYWNRGTYAGMPDNWVLIHAGTDGDRWVDPDKFKQNIWKDYEKDLWVRSVGPAPVKTPVGWLVLYHAIEAKDKGKYKLFAMMLDEKDPTKVLYRSEGPILEPEEDYENSGHKWGVVYSCGAVIRSGRLFVYYGGADTVVCVASIELKKLIDYLKRHKQVKLKKAKLLKNKF